MRLDEIEIKVADDLPPAWGYTLSLDCDSCKSDIIVNKEKLIKFTDALIRFIDMVPHGNPTVEHFPAGDPVKAGLSLVQLIETSSITIHCVDKSRDVYMDIFSCKEINVEKATQFVSKHLKPRHVEINFMSRDARGLG
jgi:S-adenosylmethionine/arginine decarboxylase-like enzyme